MNIRKQILKGFIQVFTRISDEDYQKRVWIRGEGPDCDDFDDTFCDFFEQAEPILKDYKNFGITDAQYQLLVKFRDAFNIFSKNNDLPEEFISSPEWKKIMEMAKEVLISFNYKN